MWDSDFKKTCPTCDNTEGLGPPAQPLLDENNEPYELECPKCGLQWQPGDGSTWPDRHETVESSRRDVICDWGQNPRAEESRRKAEQARRARAEELRANPPTLAEAFPLPWAQHRHFPDYIVPLEDVAKPVGSASDPEENKKYARVLARVGHADPRRGISERMVRANALLIGKLCGSAAPVKNPESEEAGPGPALEEAQP